VSRDELAVTYGVTSDRLDQLFGPAVDMFGDMVRVTADGFRIENRGRPLTRMIARSFDAYSADEARHSAAF
jgi:oxygen-independent coproporphyrinogen III oxidase